MEPISGYPDIPQESLKDSQSEIHSMHMHMACKKDTKNSHLERGVVSFLKFLHLET